MRKYSFLLLLALAGCNPAIYTRDGVTDGDSFYLSPAAMAGGDAVVQSWVVYSLTRAACQLQEGGDIPSRVDTYGCEYQARRVMIDDWDDKQALDRELENPYLDTLSQVREAGFLEEYVVHYFGNRSWQVPVEVDLKGFARWRRTNLPHHRPETHVTGSWSFAHDARTIAATPGTEAAR